MKKKILPILPYEYSATLLKISERSKLRLGTLRSKSASSLLKRKYIVDKGLRICKLLKSENFQLFTYSNDLIMLAQAAHNPNEQLFFFIPMADKFEAP